MSRALLYAALSLSLLTGCCAYLKPLPESSLAESVGVAPDMCIEKDRILERICWRSEVVGLRMKVTEQQKIIDEAIKSRKEPK